jgi:hypothetical protein
MLWQCVDLSVRLDDVRDDVRYRVSALVRIRSKSIISGYGGFSAASDRSKQWSSLPVQAQARGKSLPELRKACGLPGLLVIIE